MFEQAEVTLGRTDQDRHLVETDASPGLSEHTTQHLDALTSLARRRKELDGPIEISLWWLLVGTKEKLPEEGQPSFAPFTFLKGVQPLHRSTHRRQMLHRMAVAMGHGRKYRGRAGDQRGHQFLLSGVIKRHVQQHDHVRGRDRPAPRGSAAAQ